MSHKNVLMSHKCVKGGERKLNFVGKILTPK